MPIAGEVAREAWVGASCGVGQCLHVLNGSEREVSLRLKPVCVYQNEPQFPHQLRVFERSERRIGLGYEQGIVLGQAGDEFGIDGEVVTLHVTGAARAPIAVELFVQEKLASLGDELREVVRSRRRGVGIETKSRVPFADESDLPTDKAIEGGAGTGEHERVQRALTRSHDERPVREETGDEWTAYCHGQVMLP